MKGELRAVLIDRKKMVKIMQRIQFYLRPSIVVQLSAYSSPLPPTRNFLYISRSPLANSKKKISDHYNRKFTPKLKLKKTTGISGDQSSKDGSTTAGEAIDTIDDDSDPGDDMVNYERKHPITGSTDEEKRKNEMNHMKRDLENQTNQSRVCVTSIFTNHAMYLYSSPYF